MKALRPPPIMPTRRRPPFNPSMAVAWTIGSALNAEQLEVGRAVGAGSGEVVEYAVRPLEALGGDEFGALARRRLGMLQAAFPLVHGPAREIISRELGEDRLEINLAVAERPIAPGALEPSLIAAIDALLSGRIELGVLDVEHLDAVVIGVDEAQIVHALLDVMAGVVIDVATLVAADGVKKHVEGLAVEHVFAGVDLVAEVDAVLVKDVEDRLPTTALLGEAFFDESGRPLRIGIEVRPREGAGEGHMLGKAEAARNERRLAHLISRPEAPLLRVAANSGRALSVEHRIIGRMNGHHLALKMSGKFADRDADVRQLSLDLVAIGLAVVSVIKVEKAAVPGRDLDRFVSVILGPFRDSSEGVMGRGVGCKLGQKQARALHRSHALSPSAMNARL